MPIITTGAYVKRFTAGMNLRICNQYLLEVLAIARGAHIAGTVAALDIEGLPEVCQEHRAAALHLLLAVCNLCSHQTPIKILPFSQCHGHHGEHRLRSRTETVVQVLHGKRQFQVGPHHVVEGVHVALQLRRGGVLLLRALLEHVAHAHCICIAVVQDAGRHLAISASTPSFLVNHIAGCCSTTAALTP